jgi:hypothetical protein
MPSRSGYFGSLSQGSTAQMFKQLVLPLSTKMWNEVFSWCSSEGVDQNGRMCQAKSLVTMQDSLMYQLTREPNQSCTDSLLCAFTPARLQLSKTAQPLHRSSHTIQFWQIRGYQVSAGYILFVHKISHLTAEVLRKQSTFGSRIGLSCSA